MTRGHGPGSLAIAVGGSGHATLTRPVAAGASKRSDNKDAIVGHRPLALTKRSLAVGDGGGCMFRVYCTEMVPWVNYTVVLAQPDFSCHALLNQLCRRYRVPADSRRYCLVHARMPRTGHRMEVQVLEPDMCPALLGLDAATSRVEVHRRQSLPLAQVRRPLSKVVAQKGRTLRNLFKHRGHGKESGTDRLPLAFFFIATSNDSHLPLHPGIVCIGSEPFLGLSDIWVQQMDVQPMHAAVIVSSSQAVLVPFSGCPVYVNGERLHAPAVLSDNALICVGFELLQFRDSRNPAEQLHVLTSPLHSPNGSAPIHTSHSPPWGMPDRDVRCVDSGVELDMEPFAPVDGGLPVPDDKKPSTWEQWRHAAWVWLASEQACARAEQSPMCSPPLERALKAASMQSLLAMSPQLTMELNQLRVPGFGAQVCRQPEALPTCAAAARGSQPLFSTAEHVSANQEEQNGAAHEQRRQHEAPAAADMPLAFVVGRRLAGDLGSDHDGPAMVYAKATVDCEQKMATLPASVPAVLEETQPGAVSTLSPASICQTRPSIGGVALHVSEHVERCYAPGHAPDHPCYSPLCLQPRAACCARQSKPAAEVDHGARKVEAMAAVSKPAEGFLGEGTSVKGQPEATAATVAATTEAAITADNAAGQCKDQLCEQAELLAVCNEGHQIQLLPPTLATWTSSDVASWLATTTAAAFAPAFAAVPVTGRWLLNITALDLQDQVGVGRQHVNGVLKLINQLRALDGSLALQRALSRRKVQTDVMQAVSDELSMLHREVKVPSRSRWARLRSKLHYGGLATLKAKSNAHHAGAARGQPRS